MIVLRRLLALLASLLLVAGVARAETTGVLPAPTLPVPVLAADTGVTGGALRFATLAAALAAHSASAIAADSDEALRCMASAIYFEAKGEPLEGQLAVAEVILNRTRSGRYPADVCGVITQRGQFSFVRGGVIPAIDAGRSAYATALSVARVALASAWTSGINSALFFHARRVAPGGRMVRVAAIGNHIFYR